MKASEGEEGRDKEEEEEEEEEEEGLRATFEVCAPSLFNHRNDRREERRSGAERGGRGTAVDKKTRELRGVNWRRRGTGAEEFERDKGGGGVRTRWTVAAEGVAKGVGLEEGGSRGRANRGRLGRWGGEERTGREEGRRLEWTGTETEG